MAKFHISNLGLNPTNQHHLAPAGVDSQGYVHYNEETLNHFRWVLSKTTSWQDAKRCRDTWQQEMEINDAEESSRLSPEMRNSYRLAIYEADRAMQLREG